MRLSRWMFVVAILSCVAFVRADVRMPAIFGDHMVLQRDTSVPVWGWADPGERVTVAIDDDVKATTTAISDGRWWVRLDALNVGDVPIRLRISGKNTVEFSDVLVGDVWLCSGQSNMAFPLRHAHDAADAIPNANHPRIRLFTVKPLVAFEPQQDCTGKWMVCTPETAKEFSAAGYFFGRELNQNLDVPIGLIGSYVNGSPAEAWVSLPGLRNDPSLVRFAEIFEKIVDYKGKYPTEILPRWQREHDAWEREVEKPYQADLKAWNVSAEKAKADGQPEPPKPQLARPEPARPRAPDNSIYTPSALNNGMIAPVVPYGIKGVIWYQGESNAGEGGLYRTLFPALIADWRKSWGQGDFPFLYVQLANFQARADQPTDTHWAGLREAQAMALSMPNTAQVVSIDLGEEKEIHPANKRDVGHRLALAARHVAYGQDLVYSGPVYESMSVEGGVVRLRFSHVGGGLTIAAGPTTQPHATPPAPPTALKGFAIAGADRKFVWANARIDGDTVLVWNDQVKQPVSVRYGWANNPEVNLYNREGLPASPFRTDGPGRASAGR